MAEYTQKQKNWMATVESSMLSGYHVSLGWPDEEYDINYDFYYNYCLEQYEIYLDSLEEEGAPKAFTPPKTYQEWKEWCRESIHSEGEGEEFSASTCDLCGALPGPRHYATLLPEKMSDPSDYTAIKICDDCLFYIANGDVPDFDE